MTWDDIATTYDVRRCPSCPAGDHQKGWARNGVLHWSDRRMTKAGLRRYLMLVGTTRLHGIATMETWNRIYSLNKWATATAYVKYHIRFPLRLSAADRARVRWLASIDPTVPEYARRWAMRREAHHE